MYKHNDRCGRKSAVTTNKMKYSEAWKIKIFVIQMQENKNKDFIPHIRRDENVE